MCRIGRWSAAACLAAVIVAGVAPAEDRPACAGHGTSINFISTPKEAARLAKQEGKLVFLLHVSGNFEDPGFT